MKIAMITDALAMGGAERQLVHSAVELARRGQDVEILRYHERSDFEDLLAAGNVKSRYLPAGRPRRVRRSFAMARYLRKAGFDVVHTFKGVSSIHGRIAARLAGVPCVFAGYRDKIRPSASARWLNKVLSRWSAGWIVNSQGVRKAVAEYFKVPPEQILVVRNAVDVSSFQSSLSGPQAREAIGITDDRPVVTIVASFRAIKNYEMFFRFAEELRRLRPTPHFLVAGDGALEGYVRSLRQRHNLQDCVQLIGPCNSMADLLRATDVVVLTSWSEGLPNVLIEAGAAGLPGVSAGNGAEEVIEDGRTGYIVPIDDHVAMAHRVAQLLKDPELREQMGASAMKLVAETFSTERLGEDLLKIYSTCLAATGCRKPPPDKIDQDWKDHEV